MSQEINEPLLIKVIYFSTSGVIKEEIFPEETTFGEIIQYFNSNLKTEFLNLKKRYTFNGIIIKENNIIKNLIKIPKNNSKILIISIEIDEKEILDDESEPIISKIIKPKLYPFSLFVYTPKEGKITLEEYTSNIVREYNLKKISSLSSYCNSPNSFFISGGGIYSKNAINDFWIINKEDYSIEIKKMPQAKRDHSMIYLPNQLIFIAGGDDVKCFIFDIQKKIFINYADLNGIYSKPALLNFNNYIYCFSKLTNEKNYFERTNISNKIPAWEKIFPKFGKNVFLTNKKIFFVSKCINNLIIIGSGDNIKQSKIYIYDLTNNEINIKEYKNDLEELDNKTFDKVNEFYNIAIPKYFDREKNILIFNKKKKQIKKIHFSNSRNINNKIRMLEEEQKSNDESSIKIELQQLNNNHFENKINYIRYNIESEKKENIYKANSNRNKYNTINNEYFNQKNNNNNLIEEIYEDDEEKYDINKEYKTIQTNRNNNKINLQNQINYNPIINLKNNSIDNSTNKEEVNKEEVNKDLQFGDNLAFFENKNEKMNNEIEDDIQLSRIIKKGDEYDTLDKLTVTESLLNQIGSGRKENIKDKKHNTKKMNRLPKVQQKNSENNSLLLNNIYKIEDDKDDNYKNNRYYTLNNKNEDVSIKIE